MGYLIKNTDIESGTWTPIIDAEFSACVGVVIYKAYYSKVNNIVSCTIHGNSQFNFLTNNAGLFFVSVPIPTTILEPIGVGQLFGNPANTNIACRDSDTIYARYFFYSNTLINFNSDFCLSFQYEIN
jgi:hypothetical protein